MNGRERITVHEAAQTDARNVYLSLDAAIEYAIASPLSHSNACFLGRGKPARRRTKCQNRAR